MVSMCSFGRAVLIEGSLKAEQLLCGSTDCVVCLSEPAVYLAA